MLGFNGEKFPSWRPKQDEVIENVLNTDTRFVLLEAPTGSGKTLVGSAIHKVQKLNGTVYCCTTKQLQDQYMKDFSDFAVDVKGRSNYPCLLPGVGDASKCLESDEFKCDHRGECPYRLRVEEARHAELACLNVWALMYQIRFASRFTNLSNREDEPHRTWLILDEADTLEDSLISFAAREITPKYCKKHYLTLPNFKSEDLDYWKGWLEQALNQLSQLIERAPKEETRNELRVVQQSLRFLFLSINDSWVVEVDEYEDKVKFVPTDVSALAHQLIFQHFDRILLMSASFCGDRIFTKVMGIPKKEYSYFKVPSYFPTYRRPVYYIPVANCKKSNEAQGSYSRIVDAVDTILDVFDTEKTIIHTVSNSRAKQLRDESQHAIEIYNSQEGKETMIGFRAGATQVLASPSLERGYDFPDDACRVNIVTKVPYPYWGSKSIQVRAKKNPEWYTWQAVQKIVQMTGRSTRNANDYSVSFILDSEFNTGLIKEKGAGPLFPDWWIQAVKVISIDKVTRELLEEASK